MEHTLNEHGKSSPSETAKPNGADGIADDNDCAGNEPVYGEGRMIGVTTSGGYGHSVGKSIAFAYVEPAYAAAGTALEVRMLGHDRAATVVAEPLYDPANERMRV